MSDKEKIVTIQAALGVTTDGIWGPKSQAALDALISGDSGDGEWHLHDRDSSFAGSRRYSRLR